MVKKKTETNQTDYGFVKIKCHDCKNEMIVFGRSATEVKCSKCGSEVVVPRGGKAAIKAEILELL